MSALREAARRVLAVMDHDKLGWYLADLTPGTPANEAFDALSAALDAEDEEIAKRDARIAFTVFRLRRIAGKSAAAPTRASPLQWPTSGGI